jgi:hypothetical protein
VRQPRVIAGSLVELELFVKPPQDTNFTSFDKLNRTLTPSNFEAEIQFDKHVLDFVSASGLNSASGGGITSAYDRSGSQRLSELRVAGSWQGAARSDSVIGVVLCRVVASADSTTALNLTRFVWVDEATIAQRDNAIVSVSTSNATFTALPCNTGSIRLVGQASPTKLLVLSANPATDVVTLRYWLREDVNAGASAGANAEAPVSAERVHLTLIDIHGKTVLMRSLGEMSGAGGVDGSRAGGYELDLDIRTVPSGAYTLLLRTPTATATARILVVR